MNQFIIEFDGSCEPHNPGGWMTWAYVIRAGETVENVGIIRPVPSNTNNVAEWYALGYGLKHITEMRGMVDPFELIIRGDSKLVVNQISGTWKCNKAHLAGLRDRCLERLESIKRMGMSKWSAEWIPREQNERADALGRKIYLETVGSPMPDRSRRGAA